MKKSMQISERAKDVLTLPRKEHLKRVAKELKDNPTYPKRYPFYCCVCKANTDGLSTCHQCGHMKGRWKTDKHHCSP